MPNRVNPNVSTLACSNRRRNLSISSLRSHATAIGASHAVNTCALRCALIVALRRLAVLFCSDSSTLCGMLEARCSGPHSRSRSNPALSLFESVASHVHSKPHSWVSNGSGGPNTLDKTIR
jgi:hypothetical protein